MKLHCCALQGGSECTRKSTTPLVHEALPCGAARLLEEALPFDETPLADAALPLALRVATAAEHATNHTTEGALARRWTTRPARVGDHEAARLWQLLPRMLGRCARPQPSCASARRPPPARTPRGRQCSPSVLHSRRPNHCYDPKPPTGSASKHGRWALMAWTA